MTSDLSQNVRPVSSKPEADRAAAFTARVVGDTAATATVALAALGDRLGLFASLATDGPATSGELAARTGTEERYVREWAGGLVAAGYLERDAVDRRIALPPAHLPTLAQEAGPAFFGGVHQELLGALQRYHRIADAFRSGGGVAPEDLHEDVWLGTERFTAGWHRNLLVQHWLPLMPDVLDQLRGGARVADVGCGAGLAAVALAQAFPSCHSRRLRRTRRPWWSGPGRRRPLPAWRTGSTFHMLDAAGGLPERFDVITTFDVAARRGRSAAAAHRHPRRARPGRDTRLPGDQLCRSGGRQRRAQSPRCSTASACSTA